MWMNYFTGGAKLLAFCQVMQGACYQLKDIFFDKAYGFDE
jgi:hypothetical protein